MPTTKKKLSILNLFLILITLLAVGAAAYLWFQKGSHSSTIKEPEEPEVTSPVFLTLKPFTISVPVSEEHIDINKMLYFGIVLRVANENQKTVLLDYLPEVRSDVLLLTSKQYVNNLKQEKGKIDLQEQIKIALSRQYDAKHLVKIDEVLFTDFIIR